MAKVRRGDGYRVCKIGRIEHTPAKLEWRDDDPAWAVETEIVTMDAEGTALALFAKGTAKAKGKPAVFDKITVEGNDIGELRGLAPQTADQLRSRLCAKAME